MFANARGLPRLGPLLQVGRAHRGPPRVHGLRVRALRTNGLSRAGHAKEIGFPFSSELNIGFII
jgi:hypothetical protein